MVIIYKRKYLHKINTHIAITDMLDLWKTFFFDT